MNILKRQGLRHITQVDLERKYFKTVHICRAGKKVLSDSLEGWYQLVYILHCRNNRSRREALKEKIIKKEVVHIVGLESKYNKMVQSKIINSLGQKSKLQKPDKIFQFESPVTDWNIYQQLLTGPSSFPFSPVSIIKELRGIVIVQAVSLNPLQL